MTSMRFLHYSGGSLYSLIFSGYSDIRLSYVALPFRALASFLAPVAFLAPAAFLAPIAFLVPIVFHVPIVFLVPIAFLAPPAMSTTKCR